MFKLMASSLDAPDASMIPFDYQPRTRLVFGINAIEQIGELAVEISAKRVLLVTDPGIVSAGHAGRVIGLLEHHGLQVVCFDKVEENPTTQCVERCVEVARLLSIDTIVGLGGGSSMDTAKGCNFILSNGGQMKDYWGIGKAKLPMLPLIAIPTTGGTGSECQSFALITDQHTHQKMACGDPKAAADASLSPRLDRDVPDALLGSFLAEVEGWPERLHSFATLRVQRVCQGEDTHRLEFKHLVVGSERSRSAVLVEIGLGQDQGDVLGLGPLDGKLLGALGSSRGQSHVGPLGLRPVQGVEDPVRVVRRIGHRRSSEGDDGRAGIGCGVLAGLPGTDGVPRFDQGGRGARGLHAAPPGRPDLASRGCVAGGGGVPDEFNRHGGDVRGAGSPGRVLHLGIGNLRSVEVTAEPVQVVASAVCLAFDALAR